MMMYDAGSLRHCTLPNVFFPKLRPIDLGSTYFFAIEVNIDRLDIGLPLNYEEEKKKKGRGTGASSESLFLYLV